MRLEGGTPTLVVAVDATSGTPLLNANVSVSDSAGKRISGGMMRADEGVRVWLQAE